MFLKMPKPLSPAISSTSSYLAGLISCRSNEIRLSFAGDNRSCYGVTHGAWPTTEQFQIPLGCITKLNGIPYGKGHPLAHTVEPFPVTAGTWHTLEIAAVGNRIVCSLNGKTVSDYADVTGSHLSGAIALLARGGSVVQFREILIEELPN